MKRAKPVTCPKCQAEYRTTREFRAHICGDSPAVARTREQFGMLDGTPRKRRRSGDEYVSGAPRAMDLSPELIAKMDAEESAFNRLRDQYGPYGMSGHAGAEPANISRGEHAGFGRKSGRN